MCWDIFEKGLGNFYFVNFFCFQFLVWALSHLFCLCLCWPLVAFKLVFRQDSHMFMHCLHLSCVHTKCLIKCPNGILVLFWTPISTKLWGLSWVYMFIMFWSLVVCFTHFDPYVFRHALIMHHICTPYAHLMHILVHLSCFAYHSC